MDQRRIIKATNAAVAAESAAPLVVASTPNFAKASAAHSPSTTTMSSSGRAAKFARLYSGLPAEYAGSPNVKPCSLFSIGRIHFSPVAGCLKRMRQCSGWPSAPVYTCSACAWKPSPLMLVILRRRGQQREIERGAVARQKMVCVTHRAPLRLCLAGGLALRRQAQHSGIVPVLRHIEHQCLHHDCIPLKNGESAVTRAASSSRTSWRTSSSVCAAMRAAFSESISPSGRHNALDKLLGAVLLTSRASYEMAQKAATLGIGMPAGVSAPTGLAVRLAETADITLAGFVRRQRHVVDAHAHRITQP